MTRLGIGITLFGMVVLAITMVVDVSGMFDAVSELKGEDFTYNGGYHRCYFHHTGAGMWFVGFLLTTGGATLAALWRYFDIKRIEG